MALEGFAASAAVVLTLILLEAVLSFDNAAILAALVRRLPPKDRRKALLYGLAGAYTLRILAILAAAWLIQVPELQLLGGAYLFWLFARHFVNLVRHRNDDHHQVGQMGWLQRLGVPALWATIIQIELVDLAFAIDQVVVAVGFTDQIILIVIAAMIGILFLRLAAAVLTRVMDWLPMLEHMAYVAVGFVGLKLVIEYPLFHVHVPQAFALVMTIGFFAIPVLVKLIFGLPASRPGDHSEMK